MSKYKAGDKFVVEVDKVLSDADSPFIEGELYRIKGFKSLVFDEFGLDKLDKYYPVPTTTEYDEGYVDGKETGMGEAWKIALNLYLIAFSDRLDIFNLENDGKDKLVEIMEKFTPQQAKAKIEAWEKSKEEIKVGDVCKRKNIGNQSSFAICTKTDGWRGYFLYSDGSASLVKEKLRNWERTGKRIEINGVLEQIGGKE